MMTALGLVVAAAGVLFLWAAITNRSPLDEIRGALGRDSGKGAGSGSGGGGGGGGSFGGGGSSSSF